MPNDPRCVIGVHSTESILDQLAATLRSGVPVNAQRVNIDGQTADLLGFRALSIGELARMFGGEGSLGLRSKAWWRMRRGSLARSR